MYRGRAVASHRTDEELAVAAFRQRETGGRRGLPHEELGFRLRRDREGSQLGRPFRVTRKSDCMI